MDSFEPELKILCHLDYFLEKTNAFQICIKVLFIGQFTRQNFCAWILCLVHKTQNSCTKILPCELTYEKYFNIDSIVSPLLLTNILFIYFRAYIYGVSKKSALSVITLASPRANTPFTVVLAAAPKTPLLPREVRIPKSTFIIFTVKTP